MACLHLHVERIRLPEQGLDISPAVLLGGRNGIARKGTVDVDLFTVGPAVTVRIQVLDTQEIHVVILEVLAIGIEVESRRVAQSAVLGLGGGILQFLAGVRVLVAPIPANTIEGQSLGHRESHQAQYQAEFDPCVLFQ